MKRNNVFKRWIGVVVAVSLVLVVGASVFAQSGNKQSGGNRQAGGQPGGKGPGGGFIQHLDTDGDGKVSKEEFLAEFDRLDQNQDGYIEESEAPPPPRRNSKQQQRGQ